MADNGMSKRVKNALKTLMGQVTYDAGTGSDQAFTSILGTTHGEFDGYPVLRVLPGDVTDEKQAVRENMRTLAYIMRVSLELNQAASESTYDYMYDLTDLIIDKLDSGDAVGALHQIDGTLDSLMLNATRGDWFVTEADNGVYLGCDVNVQVMYSILF